ncbi:alpha/beta fold hydrolase, partial [bacterium]|nr:alpha/beta fold hydrolase [bacterium]
AIGLEYLLFKRLSQFTKVPPPSKEINPGTLLLNANEIPFRSVDGVDLHGWLIQGKAGCPVLIIAHEYGSSRSQVLGKLETLISSLNKQGYFIFLFDFRGHGQSSTPSALGYKEQDDLRAALKEVLKFKQIEPRIGVLGIGMGAIATIQTCGDVDSVKFIILDSVYDDIPMKLSQKIIGEYPFVQFAEPALLHAVGWNMRPITGTGSQHMNLAETMPKLYPRPVLFVEKNPLSPPARRLYDATKEPKELIQLGETASGELIGEVRERYKNEIEDKILQHFPPSLTQQTIEILK